MPILFLACISADPLTFLLIRVILQSSFYICSMNKGSIQ